MSEGQSKGGDGVSGGDATTTTNGADGFSVSRVVADTAGAVVDMAAQIGADTSQLGRELFAMAMMGSYAPGTWLGRGCAWLLGVARVRVCASHFRLHAVARLQRVRHDPCGAVHVLGSS